MLLSGEDTIRHATSSRTGVRVQETNRTQGPRKLIFKPLSERLQQQVKLLHLIDSTYYCAVLYAVWMTRAPLGTLIKFLFSPHFIGRRV